MARSARGPNVTINAAFLQEIKADHQQLQELLSQLRRLAAAPQALPNHAREFVDCLDQLRDQLAFHFSLEEAYGYFEAALESAPELDSQAWRLRSQHADLFVLARDLADAAAQRLPRTTPDWTSLVAQFSAFDEALQAHESAELDLIWAALEQDLGGGD